MKPTKIMAAIAVFFVATLAAARVCAEPALSLVIQPGGQDTPLMAFVHPNGAGTGALGTMIPVPGQTPEYIYLSPDGQLPTITVYQAPVQLAVPAPRPCAVEMMNGGFAVFFDDPWGVPTWRFGLAIGQNADESLEIWMHGMYQDTPPYSDGYVMGAVPDWGLGARDLDLADGSPYYGQDPVVDVLLNGG